MARHFLGGGAYCKHVTDYDKESHESAKVNGVLDLLQYDLLSYIFLVHVGGTISTPLLHTHVVPPLIACGNAPLK